MSRRATMAFAARTASGARELASMMCRLFIFWLVAFELRLTADRRPWCTERTQHAVEKVWPTTNLDPCGANLMSNQCPTCGAGAELRKLSNRYQRTWRGSKRVQLTDVSQYPKARVSWEATCKNRNWSASICTLFANSMESCVPESAK